MSKSFSPTLAPISSYNMLTPTVQAQTRSLKINNMALTQLCENTDTCYCSVSVEEVYLSASQRLLDVIKKCVKPIKRLQT